MKTKEELEMELANIKVEKERLVKAQMYEQSAKLRDIEKELMADIAKLKNMGDS